MKKVKILAFVTLIVLLGACTQKTKGDFPNDLDKLKVSPCACSPIEFDDRGYKWLG